MNTAATLGLAPIIYYDMEPFSAGQCGPAVAEFINGWVSQLHGSGYLAGVYGGPANSNAEWANVPDEAWIFLYNNEATIWSLAQVGDSLWPTNQRIHQYANSHNEAWGGVTFNIENDIDNASVAGGHGVKSYTFAYSIINNTGNPVTKAFGVTNSSQGNLSPAIVGTYNDPGGHRHGFRDDS
jgi:hypothetical protein